MAGRITRGTWTAGSCGGMPHFCVIPPAPGLGYSCSSLKMQAEKRTSHLYHLSPLSHSKLLAYLFQVTTTLHSCGKFLGAANSRKDVQWHAQQAFSSCNASRNSLDGVSFAFCSSGDHDRE